MPDRITLTGAWTIDKMAYRPNKQWPAPLKNGCRKWLRIFESPHLRETIQAVSFCHNHFSNTSSKSSNGSLRIGVGCFSQAKIVWGMGMTERLAEWAHAEILRRPETLLIRTSVSPAAGTKSATFAAERYPRVE